MTKYSLYMIRHAWIASAESVLIRGGSPEKRIPIGCYSWLLRNTEKKVDDIARSVGYENISYFHRLFAGHFGMSPKKYRDCK